LTNQKALEEWYKQNIPIKSIPFNDLQPIWKIVIIKEDINKIIIYEVDKRGSLKS